MGTSDIVTRALNVSIPMLLVAGVGFCLGWFKIMNEHQLMGFNKFVFRIGLAAKAFLAMSTGLPTRNELLFSLAYTCVIYAILLLVLAFSGIYAVMRRVVTRRLARKSPVRPEPEVPAQISEGDSVSVTRARCTCRPSWTQQTLGDFTTHWMCCSWSNAVIIGQPLIATIIGKEEAERLPFFHYLMVLVTGFPVFAALLELHKIREQRSPEPAATTDSVAAPVVAAVPTDSSESMTLSSRVAETPPKQELSAQSSTKSETPQSAASAHIAKRRPHSVVLRVTLRVLLHPIFIAVICGFVWALSGVELPDMLSNGFTWVSNSVTAVGLFVVGLFTSLHIREIEFKFPFLYVFVRMFVAPIIMAGVCVLLDMPQMEARVSVTLASAPLAVSCFSMLTEYSVNPQRASPCIFFGLVVLLPQQILVQWAFDQFPRFSYNAEASHT